MSGTPETRLIVIRGNSGTGKTSLAAAVRAVRPRGLAIVGQDTIRRDILRVRDVAGNSAVGLIELSVTYALNSGMDVVVEGMLYESIYGDALRRLISAHKGVTRSYRFEMPFEETLRRHTLKPNREDFGENDMRKWWRENDSLLGTQEQIIGPDDSLEKTVARVVKDCHWTE